jgi:hypothetical protein
MASNTSAKFSGVLDGLGHEQSTTVGVMSNPHPPHETINIRTIKQSLLVECSEEFLVFVAKWQRPPYWKAFTGDGRLEMIAGVFLTVLDMLLFEGAADHQMKTRRESFPFQDCLDEIKQRAITIQPMGPQF